MRKEKAKTTFTIMAYRNGFAQMWEIEANNNTIIGSFTFFVESGFIPSIKREYSWSSMTEMNREISSSLKVFGRNNATIELFMKKPLNTVTSKYERKILETLCRVLGVF